MKSLLKKIISIMTISVLAVLFCACTDTFSTNESCKDGHLFVDYSYTAPTCKTNGLYIQKCSHCGYLESETLLVIDHNYELQAATNSTCTTHGIETYKCSMCKEIITNTLPLLNHDYELVQEIQSTCATKGSRSFKCKTCTDTYSTELELIQHKFETVDTATCFSEGTTITQCSSCGFIETDNKDNHRLLHYFDEDGYCVYCGIYKTFFDKDKINLTYQIEENYLRLGGGYFIPKFKNDSGTIPTSYYSIKRIQVTITSYDKNGNKVDEFTGYNVGIPSGTIPTFQYNPNDFSFTFYVATRHAPNIYSFRLLVDIIYTNGIEPIEIIYTSSQNS